MKGMIAVAVAAVVGVDCDGSWRKVGTSIQQLGANVQNTTRARHRIGYLTYFIIGLTLGLVWVPCASRSLSLSRWYAKTRRRSIGASTAYGVGACVPLLIIGYGGRYMLSSARLLNKYTEKIKLIFGIIMILSKQSVSRSILFTNIQTHLADHDELRHHRHRYRRQLFKRPMPAGTLSHGYDYQIFLPILCISRLFPKLFALRNLPVSVRGTTVSYPRWQARKAKSSSSISGRYSCINCIRTLPYIQGYREKFKDTGKFTLIGVHTPEFTFEKDQKNVAGAQEIRAYVPCCAGQRFLEHGTRLRISIGRLAFDRCGRLYPLARTLEKGITTRRIWQSRACLRRGGYC